MATAKPLPDLRTPQEWREWEERQPERYEYLGDRPRLMAGGTVRHNRIALNIAGVLLAGLRGQRCYPLLGDVKAVLPTGKWTYPDVFVRCGSGRDRDTGVDDAVVVVEVLSPRTANYDLEDKRLDYYSIPTLRHIVYVAQDRVTVEHVRRSDDGSWRSVVYRAADHTIDLDAIGVELPIEAIYAGVDLDAREDGGDEAALPA
jgi:Uma2 family endonuclease